MDIYKYSSLLIDANSRRSSTAALINSSFYGELVFVAVGTLAVPLQDGLGKGAIPHSFVSSPCKYGAHIQSSWMYKIWALVILLCRVLVVLVFGRGRHGGGRRGGRIGRGGAGAG